MLSIQQLIRALRKLQSSAVSNTNNVAIVGNGISDLMKSLAHMVAATTTTRTTASTSGAPLTEEINREHTITPQTTFMTSLKEHEVTETDTEATILGDTTTIAITTTTTTATTTTLPKQQRDEPQINANSNSSDSSQRHRRNQERGVASIELSVAFSDESNSSNSSSSCRNDSWQLRYVDSADNASCDGSTVVSRNLCAERNSSICRKQNTEQIADIVNEQYKLNPIANGTKALAYNLLGLHQQSNNNICNQLKHHLHTQQQSGGLCTKQKQTQFAMSSLAAAEPITALNPEMPPMPSLNLSPNNEAQNDNDDNVCNQHNKSPAGNCSSSTVTSTAKATGKPCFNTGLGDILQFMELIGNLKHTKRTGWVLRDVDDCESISGHMYRMSMMTFLLDGTEGLNQIRCMELALVHDLAESLVGDITPFCGVSKTEKRAMEFKAMEDICKLIEPRGKRIMELFEEYEQGESAESKFVKDLDRLDMVMQAFEYEKRDNCLLKHQEFFDSTEGKFNHPFVKKLVNEIYEQRKILAENQGATPPPPVHVPNMDVNGAANGHCNQQQLNGSSQEEQHKSTSTSS